MRASWIETLKVIGWDVDGTLYQADSALSQEIDRLKIARVAEKLGCSIRKATEQFQQMLTKLKSNTKTLDALGIDGQAFFISVWDEIDLSQHIHPNPTLVQAFLHEKRYKFAILSNSNTPAQVERKLQLIGLAPAMFSKILTSTDIGANKPDPQAFLAFVACVGAQAKEILYVGDREDVDIIPAHKLGLRTGIVYGKSEIVDISAHDPVDLLTKLR